jgi:hypothetical protein
MADPILIKAGDTRVLINGNPLLVDARIVAEEYYQRLLVASQQPSIRWVKVLLKQQRNLCYDAWLHMPEFDNDSPLEKRELAQRHILNAPEPSLEESPSIKEEEWKEAIKNLLDERGADLKSYYGVSFKDGAEWAKKFLNK